MKRTIIETASTGKDEPLSSLSLYIQSEIRAKKPAVDISPNDAAIGVAMLSVYN